MKHRLRMHSWHNGRLIKQDHWFDSLELALDFVSTTDSEWQQFKIFDARNQVVHHRDLADSLENSGYSYPQ